MYNDANRGKSNMSSSVIRKTIALPKELAEWVEEISELNQRTFNGQVVRLLSIVKGLAPVDGEPQILSFSENKDDE